MISESDGDCVLLAYQRIRGSATIRYINLRLTLTLTMRLHSAICEFVNSIPVIQGFEFISQSHHKLKSFTCLLTIFSNTDQPILYILGWLWREKSLFAIS